MIWFALTIPLIAAVYLAFKYKRKVVWWEFLIPLAFTLILIFLSKFIYLKTQTKDYEFWGSYVTQVNYYEPWDEWIVQICTKQVPAGTDSRGNTIYTTVTYDCSHREYHPARYIMKLNTGEKMRITKKRYERIRRLFTNSHFKDLHRDYYTQDGDLYYSTYDGSYEKFIFIATKHTYENCVQAASSVFNFPKVTKKEIKEFELFDYPEITGFHKLPAILADSTIKITKEEIKKFDWINGMLGKKKQLRVWVILFKNQPRQAGLLQEAYWKGGNKNEFNVAIGIDKDLNIQWCYPFSWTEVQSLKIETRSFVMGMKKLALTKLANFLYPELEKKFVRKQFRDFSYLDIPLPLWLVLLIYFLTIIITLYTSIWAVNNRFED